jgi:hypothetical protein
MGGLARTEIKMGIGGLAKGGFAGVLLKWASGLRFPYLFVLTFALFIVNLVVPDVIPMVDELVMGLVALMLGSLRKRRAGDDSTVQGEDESDA